MPTWEVDLLVQAINEVRREEDRMMKQASRGGGGNIGFK